MKKDVLIVDNNYDIYPHIKEDGKIILKGIFTEFNTKHHGRIYSAEDYLPHLQELKNRKITKETNESKEI